MVTIVQNNIWNICTEVVIWGKYICLNAIEKTDWYCTKIVIDRQARKRCNNYTLIDNERIFIESELDEKNRMFVFLNVPRCHHNAMLYTLYMSLGILVPWILYSVLNMQFYIAYSGRGSAGKQNSSKGAVYIITLAWATRDHDRIRAFSTMKEIANHPFDNAKERLPFPKSQYILDKNYLFTLCVVFYDN